MNAGRDRSDDYQSAEAYGKHSRSHARGLSVAELLRRAARRGEALRLAWRDDPPEATIDRYEEFPTGVLPVVQGELAEVAALEEDTAPTTTTRAARKWLQPPPFLVVAAVLVVEQRFKQKIFMTAPRN